MRQLLSSILQVMPPRLSAAADFYLHPGIRGVQGGAFNGQHVRKQIFFELVKQFPFKAIVETGTYRANTTIFFSKHSRVPIFTVEANPRYFHYAKRRTRPYKRVHIAHGDSVRFLNQLSHRSTFPKDHVFFYLDAHWQENLPLRAEVEMIFKHWKEVVVMIDDFEVPGDEGYTFDDYGSEKRLSLDYLPSLSQLGAAAFFPSLNSKHESGMKRGCVVLMDQHAVDKVGTLNALRQHKPAA